MSGTVGSADTKRKAEALQKWIKEQNKVSKDFKGGIISKVGGIWKINSKDVYKIDANYSEWEELDEMF